VQLASAEAVSDAGPSISGSTLADSLAPLAPLAPSQRQAITAHVEAEVLRVVQELTGEAAAAPETPLMTGYSR